MSRGLLLPLVAIVGLVIGSVSTQLVTRLRRDLGGRPHVLGPPTAALFVVLALVFGSDVALPAYCILATTLVTQSWIDLRTKTLPRPITMWATAIGAVALATAAVVRDEPERIWTAGLGALIATALLGGIYAASRRTDAGATGFGWGDVVLAPLLGMYLGWLHPVLVPVAFLISFCSAAVAGIGALVAGADRRTALPFGPFLALGTIIAIVAGQPLLDAFTAS